MVGCDFISASLALNVSNKWKALRSSPTPFSLAQAGFRGLRLGPRILRTETAGLAALAALQALHGDL
jgi:hypothetical protein